MTTQTISLPADWRDFLALTKPRVMTLVVFTGLCGMLAAPVSVHPVIGFTAILCIALGAGAAGALNQWYEADLDAKMRRTAGRPLPAGRMDKQSALHFGVGLAAFSVLLMGLAANVLAAGILAASILFYVLVYTVWLKPRTPQNIVIGGAAGAFPPLIGWAAATGTLAPLPVLLFALVFLWTPPHFWALALFRSDDYARANVPMLPVVAGPDATRLQILLYTVVLVAVAISPWPLGYFSAVYGVTSVALGAGMLWFAIQVYRHRTGRLAAHATRALFKFSLVYLFMLFAILLLEVAVSALLRVVW